MTPEAKVKAAIRMYLRGIGAYYVQPIGSGYGAASLDFFVCHKGRFYGIEAKRPGVTKPTARQACVMRDVAAAGGGVCLATSVDDVKRMLGDG